MDAFQQRVYLEQIERQCERCFVSIDSMTAVLNKTQDGDFFRYALELVNHAAAVSRMLWPGLSRDKEGRKRAARRSEFLRRLLGVASGHAVQDRTLRDHFEHFDERLDAWAQQVSNRNFIEGIIGSRNMFGGDAIRDTDIITHFDPTTNIFTFRGERFNLQSLADGLVDIRHRTVNILMTMDNTWVFRNAISRFGDPQGVRAALDPRPNS